jgi:pre-mRNA cleavage complex 2 protein Pcf11
VPDNSIDTLNSDIADLITTSKAEFAQNPYDGNIQTRLKALLDLQSILRSQKLPPEQIAMIKDQVAHLSLPAKPPPAPAPVLVSAPVLAPASVTVSQPPAQPQSLSDLLGGPAALAALLARSSATPKVPTPPTPQPVQPVRSPQLQYTNPQYTSAPAPPTAPAPVADPVSLLEKLRAAGMLPPLPTATSAPLVPPSALASTLPPNLPQSLPFVNQAQVHSNLKPHQSEIVNDVQLKPASLKM